MRLVDRRYRLEEQVGVGGMAVVWRAFDERLQRVVAVKLLNRRYVADRAMRRRLRVEALCAARLAHPNVARVYDFGVGGLRTAGRAPYIVMEFLHGPSLADRIRGGPLPWTSAVHWAAQAAAGLAAAHAEGVVHRDVKPANLMLAPSGLKVVDFGIAVATDATADPDGAVLGTPLYVAPERLRGEEATAAADVYGLGLSLYHSLAGALPWRPESGSVPVEARCHTEPAALPPIEGLPASVAELLQRCLAIRPEARPSSLEIARLLGRAAGVDLAVPHHHSAMPRTPAMPAEDRDATVIREGTRLLAVRRDGRGLRRTATLAGAGLAAVAVLAVSSLAGFDPLSSAAPPASTGNSEPTSAAVSPTAQRYCMAHYFLVHGPSDRFTAYLTVLNAGQRTRAGWSLTFTVPTAQRLTALRGGSWTRGGRVLTIRGGKPLQPGQTVRLVLQGVGRPDPRAPDSFSLDGTVCQNDRTGVSVGRTDPNASTASNPTPYRPPTRRATVTPSTTSATAGPSSGEASAPAGSSPTVGATPDADPTRSPDPTVTPPPSPSPSPPSPSAPATVAPTSPAAPGSAGSGQAEPAGGV
jgi:serine/threonine-protein kinase